MRLYPILGWALLLTACSQSKPDDLWFIHQDEVRAEGDPSALFLADALSRLTHDEKSHYERLGNVAGFEFRTQKYTCIVIVSLRTDVINHAPDPAFCYDESTNEFAQ